MNPVVSHSRLNSRTQLVCILIIAAQWNKSYGPTFRNWAAITGMNRSASWTTVLMWACIIELRIIARIIILASGSHKQSFYKMFRNKHTTSSKSWYSSTPTNMTSWMNWNLCKEVRKCDEVYRTIRKQYKFVYANSCDWNNKTWNDDNVDVVC